MPPERAVDVFADSGSLAPNESSVLQARKNVETDLAAELHHYYMDGTNGAGAIASTQPGGRHDGTPALQGAGCRCEQEILDRARSDARQVRYTRNFEIPQCLDLPG